MTTMRAMVLSAIGAPLVLEERRLREPGPGEIRVRVEACAVCRTDLHVVDGDLLDPRLPIVPGHEIVGIVEAAGRGVLHPLPGQRVGIPWLGHTCGACPYCRSDRENLCDAPLFTGYTRDGGFASHVIADAAFAFPLDGYDDPVAAAPLMCAGLIGWRSLRIAGDGEAVGLYGFGAAAHILAQVLVWQGRRRRWRCRSARPLHRDQRRRHPSRSMPPSSSLRSVLWSRSRSPPSRKAAASSAAASI